MPLSDLHKQKFKKNWQMLGLIVLWIAIIWVITMLQIDSYNSKQLEAKKALEIEKQNSEGAVKP